MAIVAHRPLERRLLADRSQDPLLVRMAEKYGASPAQIALACLAAQEAVVPIPKASQKEHVEENLESLGVTLQPEDRSSLDRMGV
jgi:diketogulonate reductase-like aldo/keto reductase